MTSLMPNTHRRRDSTVVTQFTVSYAVELLMLVISDDIMMSLLKKLLISIKIHAVKPLCSVSKLSAESVGSHHDLVANCVHTADATQLDSCVGGVYWALTTLVLTWEWPGSWLERRSGADTDL